MSHGKLSKLFAEPVIELGCGIREEVFGSLEDEEGTVEYPQQWPLVLWYGRGSTLSVC